MDKQIDGELALLSVMHIVCKYANPKDLCNIAQVCKSWYDAATHEKGKRWFQYLHFSSKCDNLASRLDVRPAASLLISGPRLKDSLILKDLKKTLPNKIIVLKVNEYQLTAKGAETQSTKEEHDFLGLFFPSIEERFRVRVPGRLKLTFKKLQLSGGVQNCSVPSVPYYAEELGLDDCKYPECTVLLLVTKLNNSVRNIIMGELDIRAKENGKKIVWATIMVDMVLTGDHHDERNCIFEENLMLSISGRSVESWSTFISYYASREEIEYKLQKLKNKVKRKPHYVGLFSSAICITAGCNHHGHPIVNRDEMMDKLKHIFPNIQFAGLFKKEYGFQSSVNPHIPNEASCDNEDSTFGEDFLSRLHEFASIIIISYDYDY